MIVNVGLIEELWLRFVQVLLGITDPELHILDEFEDVEYERSTVEVSLMVKHSVLLFSLSIIRHSLQTSIDTRIRALRKLERLHQF